ncbi:hypothetical protein EMIHUDRAFT_115697 [Emiliania huxleyi CCMP1516]|uniref:Serine aminopeptidase S33 domain-containing protein n=2 Tax=Emiliania huxleyi TaxID=2903 RepID=A0A0D3IMS1_EMIH1|nr:hypothetical protein EMIHUDRAFT_120072 [Emiliania huxleyi CCMP1516]XP_005777415.1 hypothetical protein EMIHUDRAFT_115697 [Emiliania huxleyi CCMP1516]EOD12556.1 hypothetical protein EMIHUDRAFT_120072 [Emiliania huxleyi CCMP1516]EOD24986.1 hypothetical protein EMIHUDRAFT_115697 [Emiliania huxleyi CCMP1516]|eukprot:XP_005764985.1 hypothetical protein EMIHUDRAFT_120072 [Emiliania huxleyi CCMP1516]
MWLLQAGALLAYGSPTPARARTARMAATADAPFWFDPCLEFGLDEPRPDAGTLPLLLVLPGADGSGITAWMQFPSLAQEYAVRALCVPAGDRSSHADLVALVSQEVRSVGEGRELFLLGESMGSGVAIDVALDVPQELSGLLLVSPATGWHRKLGYRILTWRDSVLVSRCRCVYVEGAGHAGATDDRLDLRAELAAWRREVIEVSRKEPTTAATV